MDVIDEPDTLQMRLQIARISNKRCLENRIMCRRVLENYFSFNGEIAYYFKRNRIVFIASKIYSKLKIKHKYGAITKMKSENAKHRENVKIVKHTRYINPRNVPARNLLAERDATRICNMYIRVRNAHLLNCTNCFNQLLKTEQINVQRVS